MNDELDQSHPLLLDLLRTLQQCEDKESAIRAVMDTVAGMLRPERLCYVPNKGTPIGDAGAWTSGARLLPDQIVKLLPSKKGFSLAIKEKGLRIGTLCADDVERPRSLDSMLPILLMVPDALEIAFSNIRALEGLRLSEAKLAQLSESLAVANRILRHDIANEILVVSSSLDLYKANQRERDLARAQSSLQRMQGIVLKMRELDGFLLSRTEMMPTNLREVIDKAMPSVEIAYEVVGDGNVLADPAIGAIIENMASNAKRHGMAGHITFTISQGNGTVLLTVRDDGKGIPEEHLPRVFIEGAAFGEARGTGLGLYLIKRTMERYGGSITAGNDPRGGARFELTFQSA